MKKHLNVSINRLIHFEHNALVEMIVSIDNFYE